jgi:arsenite methyltransferase
VERVLRAWEKHLAHPSLPRTLGARLRVAGFNDIEMVAHPFASCELDPETYGAGMLPVISSFVPGHQGVTERELGERGEYFSSITQFCFRATKP